MSELAETTQFLAGREPWSLLPPDAVASFARRASGSYVRRGGVILAAGSAPGVMHVIRSGAVEVRDAADGLVTHEEPGACFGQASILEERGSRFTFVALEDTLLWTFGTDVVEELVAVPEIRRFFTESRLADANVRSPEGGPVLQVPVRDMITREPVTILETATVGEAATAMDAQRISAIIVTGTDGGLAGILTDRDLRRVVARDLPASTPLREVMSTTPVTIDGDALALDVLMRLVDRKIHHLPVMVDGHVTGMVTSGDLMRLERSSPLYIVGDISRQNDLAGLVSVVGRVPSLVSRLLRQDAAAFDIAHIVSGTSEALWQRLAQLTEERLGPPPVPYCWVALGSLARREQALGSDQDHAMILSDEALPEHDAYFEELAEELTAALVACGFPRCHGDAMATKWRKPLTGWWRTFSSWLDAPTSEAVLNSSIFFDMRPIHGDATLAAELQRRILATAPASTRFLGHMAGHIGDVDVPIGFLGGFVVEKRGQHRDRLDIKLGGINPIVDIARHHSLRYGLPHVGTRARLTAAGAHLSEVDNLLDAHEFMSYTRLQHQDRQVLRGEAPDNFIAPSRLSEFERRHLRSAFAFVGRAQTALGLAYQTHILR